MLATVNSDEMDFEFKDYRKTCREPEGYLLQEQKPKLEFMEELTSIHTVNFYFVRVSAQLFLESNAGG